MRESKHNAAAARNLAATYSMLQYMCIAVGAAVTVVKDSWVLL